MTGFAGVGQPSRPERRSAPFVTRVPLLPNRHRADRASVGQGLGPCTLIFWSALYNVCWAGKLRLQASARNDRFWDILALQSRGGERPLLPEAVICGLTFKWFLNDPDWAGGGLAACGMAIEDSCRCPANRMADAAGPTFAIRCPTCERRLRAIPDVPINWLELNSRADVSGKPGFVHFKTNNSLRSHPKLYYIYQILNCII
jgi:hypothetical protein